MLKNYLKITLRYLLRNKIYSGINIFGLAVGIAACFAIMQYVHFELSYDRFHKHAESIYRVTLEWGEDKLATNHPAAGPALQSDFPEVVEFARAAPVSIFTNSVTLTHIDEQGVKNSINEEGIYLVDSSFLTIFSFPFIYGNSGIPFPTGNSIVITRSLSGKFFGSENPVGKVLMINGMQPLEISGVIEDVPENSHIKFHILAQLRLGDYDNSWEWPEYYTYIRLAPGTNLAEFQAKLTGFSSKYLEKTMKEYNTDISFHLQPLTKIYLQSQNLDKEREARGNEKAVFFLLIIGVMILIIAWINYINLSTSKSLERAREVGLRKIAGASKPALVKQFLFESAIINSISLILAFIMLNIFLPYFNQLTGKNMGSDISALGLFSEPLFWVTMTGIIITGSLLAGVYPALVVSSFKSISVISGKFLRSASGILLRKILVGGQFAISIGLMAGTFLVFRQVIFMKNRDLGFPEDQLLIIKTPSVIDSTIFNRSEVFRNELLKNPEINDMAPSSEVPGRLIPILNGIRIKGKDISENFHCYMNSINKDFINTYGLNIIAGRIYRDNEKSNPYEAEINPIILNELAVQKLGFKTPEESINKLITYKFGPSERTGEIIGVVNNYHQRSLKDNLDPLLFYSAPFFDVHYYTININTARIHESVKFIEDQYKSLFPDSPFEYFFLDEYFNRQYASENQFGKVFGVFSIIAIIVACLGLYGLTTLMVAQRTKEIAIRKVLGAKISTILILLTKDFILLILLADLIALPVVFFYARNWLNHFAFHINLDWSIFVFPTVMLLIIILVSTSFQTIRTALVNPAESLKYE
jgi:putative ABC transport system permease protein